MTTAATQTITSFLLDRITEDEAAAREAVDPERPGTHWRWFNDDDTESTPDPDTDGDYITYPCSLRTVEEFPTRSVGLLPAFAVAHAEEVKAGVAAHIARHDPARVLAECASKRRIVDFAFEYAETIDGEWGDAHTARAIRDGVCPRAMAHAEEVLAPLAAVYADHPDYRDDWRP